MILPIELGHVIMRGLRDDGKLWLHHRALFMDSQRRIIDPGRSEDVCYLNEMVREA